MEFGSYDLKRVLIAALLFAVTYAYMVKRKRKKIKEDGEMPPEPAGAWPLLGHIPLFLSDGLSHKSMAAIADIHGPIYSLRLGSQRAIVVSNSGIAKDCFTVNDKVFSTRPRYSVLKWMGYEEAMFGFASYGQYWRDMRKLTMSHLLSVSRLELQKHVRDSEINYVIKELYEQCLKKGEPISIEMKETMGDLVMNIIMRKVAGRRYSSADPESRKWQNNLSILLSVLFRTFSIFDFFPALSWLDFINFNLGEMKRTRDEIEEFLSKLVKEHRQKKEEGTTHEDEKDFIDIMLSVMDDAESSAQEVDSAIKGTCLSLITGGGKTIADTVDWALRLLLSHRHDLEKVQDELNTRIGDHRVVDESDTEALPYLQAVVKETLRSKTPLLPTREAMQDCTISGYKIKKGTRLHVNLWRLHTDPNTWQNPLEFIPQRFLTTHAETNVKGRDFQYLPFGSGRRICPGIALALQTTHLILARLLHAFDLRTVPDLPVDITQHSHLDAHNAAPFPVLLTPRPPAGLYA